MLNILDIFSKILHRAKVIVFWIGRATERNGVIYQQINKRVKATPEILFEDLSSAIAIILLNAALT